MQQIVSNEISNGLNVLIVGNLIPKIAESKYLNKLYITSTEEYKGAINITFNNSTKAILSPFTSLLTPRNGLIPFSRHRNQSSCPYQE